MRVSTLVLSILVFLFLLQNNVLKACIKIKYKIGDDIITNTDINNEKNYLIFLRPDLRNLSNDEILKISQNSLIRELIKKKEIKRVFKDLNNELIINEVKKKLFIFKNVSSEKEFLKLLETSNLDYEKIVEKMKYEAFWNELIFQKYNQLIKIDKEKLKSLETLFLAGERADPDTVLWLENKLNIPIVDHWWQTETGWPIAANPTGIELLPIKKGSPTVSLPGYEIDILDDNGEKLSSNELGSICIKLPLPPSCLPSLWAADDRFIEAYLSKFPGYYETGDAGYIDDDGYIFVMSRTDDVINTAGHRLSTGAMEEVVSNHSDVAECAVVGVKDELKGEVPVGLACLNAGCNREHSEICNEIIDLIRKEIGPVASFKKVAIVQALPKTRSGKILRKTIRSIINKEQWTMPPTVENPNVFDDCKIALKNFNII